MAFVSHFFYRFQVTGIAPKTSLELLSKPVKASALPAFRAPENDEANPPSGLISGGQLHCEAQHRPRAPPPPFLP
jgi:hypothetical protein